MKSCNKCKAELPDEAQFCNQCGNPLSKYIGMQCSKCNRLNDAKTKYCINCGSQKLKPYFEFEEL